MIIKGIKIAGIEFFKIENTSFFLYFVLSIVKLLLFPMKNIYKTNPRAKRIPGIYPARKSAPIDNWADTPKITADVLGGIIGPKIEAEAVKAADVSFS